MDVLVVYGTVEGHTQKVAKFVATHLEEQGHSITLHDSNKKMEGLWVPSYDAVILASSVHQQRHKGSLANFILSQRKSLAEMPSLFISVSLSIAFEGGHNEAQSYVDHLFSHCNFEADTTLLVGGALQFDKYDYYMNQIVEHIVLAEHELVSEDREFTNWEQLARDLDEFVKLENTKSV